MCYTLCLKHTPLFKIRAGWGKHRTNIGGQIRISNEGVNGRTSECNTLEDAPEVGLSCFALCCGLFFRCAFSIRAVEVADEI